MAQAYPLSARETVIRLHKSGMSRINISVQLGMSYNTVKSLVKQYLSKGEPGLQSNYHRCGRLLSEESERSYRLVRLYKHFHPGWGVGYILMKLKEKYPTLKFCVSRVYERRLKQQHLISMPRNPPLPTVHYTERALLPHDTWQVDAKEQFTTLDGIAACYLTITDEKTGGILEGKVFPPQSDQSSTH
jgi:hypothetical protein